MFGEELTRYTKKDPVENVETTEGEWSSTGLKKKSFDEQREQNDLDKYLKIRNQNQDVDTLSRTNQTELDKYIVKRSNTLGKQKQSSLDSQKSEDTEKDQVNDEDLQTYLDERKTVIKEDDISLEDPDDEDEKYLRRRKEILQNKEK